MTTKLTIQSKDWFPEVRQDPDEEFPEGRITQFPHWELQITFSSDVSGYSGPQHCDLPEDADDADFLEYTKSAWGSTDKWELAE